MRRALTSVALILGSLVVALFAGAAEAAHSGYPDSIAVLGHSGATGENSDPKRPGLEVRANSWATGTNPAVNSVYLRLLRANPKIRGHNFNLAQGGANVDRLYDQAIAAPKLRPRPDLFVVQIMDGDIQCNGTDAANTPRFRAKLTTVLKLLARGAPDAHIFVVSQFGSPATYFASLTPAQRKRFGGGSGPCDFVTSSGQLIPKRVAYLESLIHGYEAALAAACKRVAICRYDGGAFGRIVERRGDFSSDANHFSIQGHARAASVAWAAMKRTGVIPRG